MRVCVHDCGCGYTSRYLRTHQQSAHVGACTYLGFLCVHANTSVDVAPLQPRVQIAADAFMHGIRVNGVCAYI